MSTATGKQGTAPTVQRRREQALVGIWGVVGVGTALLWWTTTLSLHAPVAWAIVVSTVIVFAAASCDHHLNAVKAGRPAAQRSTRQLLALLLASIGTAGMVMLVTTLTVLVIHPPQLQGSWFSTAGAVGALLQQIEERLLTFAGISIASGLLLGLLRTDPLSSTPRTPDPMRHAMPTGCTGGGGPATACALRHRDQAGVRDAH